ncbi:hypothetical protein [Xenococcus sp. PCC 7305]|nr:hypothetical protein [Xenococcus sp. PCC 7305]
MTHKAPSFAERNLFFSDRVWSWFHLVELRFSNSSVWEHHESS